MTEPLDGPLGPPVLPALWAAKWSIVVTAICAALIGFGVSALQPTTYQAQAELLLVDPRNSGLFEETGVNFLDPSRYVRNQAELARSAPVITRTAELIGGRLSTDAVTRALTVRPSVDLDLLTVLASDRTGPGAAQIATAAGEAYQQIVREQVQGNADSSLAEIEGQRVQLEATIAEAEAELATAPGDSSLTAERDSAITQLVDLRSRADQIAVDASLFGSGVQQFQEADIPESPAAPQPMRNAALAFVLGALAAGGLAWWRAEETATADGRNDPSTVLNAPLLGSVPDFAESGLDTVLPTVAAPKSPPAEAYQFLVGALAHAMEEVDGRSVLITSAGPADGKTMTTLNLAVAASQDGRDVLVVDADTRMRGLTRILGLAHEAGLPELADGRPLAEVVELAGIGEGHALPVIPAMPMGKDTAAFFRTPGFLRAVKVLVAPADLVLFDTPPLLLAADTAAIARCVDGIVVVVARGTPMRTLREMRERLDLTGTPVLGYIFTKATSGTGYGAYGRYGYRYGYGEDPADRGPEAVGDAPSSTKRRLSGIGAGPKK